LVMEKSSWKSYHWFWLKLFFETTFFFFFCNFAKTRLQNPPSPLPQPTPIFNSILHHKTLNPKFKNTHNFVPWCGVHKILPILCINYTTF
jgi:hypothetical protein